MRAYCIAQGTRCSVVIKWERYLKKKGCIRIGLSSWHYICESCSVMSNSLWPHGLYSPWNSAGRNTGAGSLSLLQAIFLTQRLNPGLPYCRQVLYQLSHKGSLRILQWGPLLLDKFSFPQSPKYKIRGSVWFTTTSYPLLPINSQVQCLQPLKKPPPTFFLFKCCYCNSGIRSEPKGHLPFTLEASALGCRTLPFPPLFSLLSGFLIPAQASEHSSFWNYLSRLVEWLLWTACLSHIEALTPKVKALRGGALGS